MQARGDLQGRSRRATTSSSRATAADPNADFLRSGQRRGHQETRSTPATSRSSARPTPTTGTRPVAQTEHGAVPDRPTTTRSMPSCRENDGMAGGVVAALDGQGLAGKVPVSGQDGDPAALNRVALGTQTVAVWKDARELGKAAGEAAIAARARTRTSTKIAGASSFRRPGGNNVKSILLTPIADHQGQPQRRDRRGLDHEGRALRGRRRRHRRACG